MPSQQQNAPASHQQQLHQQPRPDAQDLQDVDTQLIVHQLRDLYAQRKAWQAGQPMALYLAPFSSFGPGVAPVEHWVGTSEEAEAYLLAAPLNALIEHYEQVLWLAGVPLP